MNELRVCKHCTRDFEVPSEPKDIPWRFCDRCLADIKDYPKGVTLQDYLNSVGALHIKMRVPLEAGESLEPFAVMEMLNSIQKQIDYNLKK